MNLLHELVAHLIQAPGPRLCLPEHRSVELYSTSLGLAFAPPPPPPEVPVPALAGACRAFLVLDAFLEFGPSGRRPRTPWQKYLSLPRETRGDKLVAELYRILRIAHELAFLQGGHVEMSHGIVKLNGVIDRVALSLEISAAGLTLLESAVAYYLESLRQPYPAAYVEALLSQYFVDIVGEVKRFSDQDRVLFQYQQKVPFNRHFRLDFGNPHVQRKDGRLEFEVGPLHRDPARHPIDFFVVIDEVLHIVPIEALQGGALPSEELSRWRARTPDGVTLPSHFRPRFPREPIVVGQPMT